MIPLLKPNLEVGVMLIILEMLVRIIIEEKDQVYSIIIIEKYTKEE